MKITASIRELISFDAVIIAAIQEKLRATGWRWDERVFNDGHHNDTMIAITQDTTTRTVRHSSDAVPDNQTVGWGRFNRLQCWEYAESFVDRWSTVENYRAAGMPRREDW